MLSKNEKGKNQVPKWVTHVVVTQDGAIVFMASRKRSAQSVARALTNRGNHAMVRNWPIPEDKE